MELVIVFAIVITAAVIAYIMMVKQIAKHTFQCKQCSKEFNTNWKNLLFAMHADDEYEIVCPHCNNKGCIEKTEQR